MRRMMRREGPQVQRLREKQTRRMQSANDSADQERIDAEDPERIICHVFATKGQCPDSSVCNRLHVSKLACSRCAELLPLERFSKNQRKVPDESRRCMACINGGAKSNPASSPSKPVKPAKKRPLNKQQRANPGSAAVFYAALRDYLRCEGAVASDASLLLSQLGAEFPKAKRPAELRDIGWLALLEQAAAVTGGAVAFYLVDCHRPGYAAVWTDREEEKEGKEENMEKEDSDGGKQSSLSSDSQNHPSYLKPKRNSQGGVESNPACSPKTKPKKKKKTKKGTQKEGAEESEQKEGETKRLHAKSVNKAPKRDPNLKSPWDDFDPFDTSGSGPNSDSSFSYSYFFSHRGPDTKDVLLKPLNHVLRILWERECQEGQTRIQRRDLDLIFFDQDLRGRGMILGEKNSESMRRGLLTCRFGVVVVSKTFFDSRYCVKELATLLKREEEEGRGLVIPIWFGLDCDCASLPAEVKAQYAPLIEALKQRSRLVYNPSTKSDSKTFDKFFVDTLVNQLFCRLKDVFKENKNEIVKEPDRPNVVWLLQQWRRDNGVGTYKLDKEDPYEKVARIRHELWQALGIDDPDALKKVIDTARGDVPVTEFLFQYELKMWSGSAGKGSTGERVGLVPIAAGNTHGVPKRGALKCLEMLLAFKPSQEQLDKALEMAIPQGLLRDGAVKVLLKAGAKKKTAPRQRTMRHKPKKPSASSLPPPPASGFGIFEGWKRGEKFGWIRIKETKPLFVHQSAVKTQVLPKGAIVKFTSGKRREKIVATHVQMALNPNLNQVHRFLYASFDDRSESKLDFEFGCVSCSFRCVVIETDLDIQQDDVEHMLTTFCKAKNWNYLPARKKKMMESKEWLVVFSSSKDLNAMLVNLSGQRIARNKYFSIDHALLADVLAGAAIGCKRFWPEGYNFFVGFTIHPALMESLNLVKQTLCNQGASSTAREFYVTVALLRISSLKDLQLVRQVLVDERQIDVEEKDANIKLSQLGHFDDNGVAYAGLQYNDSVKSLIDRLHEALDDNVMPTAWQESNTPHIAVSKVSKLDSISQDDLSKINTLIQRQPSVPMRISQLRLFSVVIPADPESGVYCDF